MIEGETSIKIGELLVRAGILTGVDLSEAEKLSKHMQLQFGRVLIMSGCLAEQDLESALEAQALIRDGMVNVDLACQALGISSREGVTIQEALEVLNVVPKFGTATLELAELLADAAIISGEVLGETLQESLHTNASLGELLVQKKAMSPSLLPILDSMLQLIRAGELVQADAVEEIRKTYYIWAKADRAMDHDPMSQTPILSFSDTPQFVTADQLYSSPYSVPSAPPQPVGYSAGPPPSPGHYNAGPAPGPSIDEFMSSFSDFAAQQYMLNPPAAQTQAPVDQQHYEQQYEQQYELHLPEEVPSQAEEHSIFDVLTIFQEKISSPEFGQALDQTSHVPEPEAPRVYNEAAYSAEPIPGREMSARHGGARGGDPTTQSGSYKLETGSSTSAFERMRMRRDQEQPAASDSGWRSEPDRAGGPPPAAPIAAEYGGGDAPGEDATVVQGFPERSGRADQFFQETDEQPAEQFTEQPADESAPYELRPELESPIFDALVAARFEQSSVHAAFEDEHQLPGYDDADVQQEQPQPAEYDLQQERQPHSQYEEGQEQTEATERELELSEPQFEEPPVRGYEKSSSFSGVDESTPRGDLGRHPLEYPWTAPIGADAADQPEDMVAPDQAQAEQMDTDAEGQPEVEPLPADAEEALPNIFEDEETEQETFEPTSTLIELLVESGHLQREHIYQAYLRALQDNQQSAKLLAVLEMSDTDTIAAAVICSSALIADQLNPDEAIEVLYAIKCGAPVREALAMANLSLPEPPVVVAAERTPAGSASWSANEAYLHEEALDELAVSESPEIDGALSIGERQSTTEIFDASDFEDEAAVGPPKASTPKALLPKAATPVAPTPEALPPVTPLPTPSRAKQKPGHGNPFEKMRLKPGSEGAPPVWVTDTPSSPPVSKPGSDGHPTPPKPVSATPPVDQTDPTTSTFWTPDKTGSPVWIPESPATLTVPSATTAPAASSTTAPAGSDAPPVAKLSFSLSPLAAAMDGGDSQWDLDSFSADANPEHEREPLPEKFVTTETSASEMAESDSTPAAPARGADAADSEWILADVPTVEKGWWGLTDSARAVLESTKPAAGESEPAEAIIESEAPQSQSEPVDKDEAQAESEAEHKAEAADEPQAEPEAEPEPHPTPVPTAAGSAKNDRKGKATTRKKLPVSGGTTPEAPAQSKKAIEEQAKAAAAKDAAKKPLKNRKKKR